MIDIRHGGKRYRDPTPPLAGRFPCRAPTASGSRSRPLRGRSVHGRTAETASAEADGNRTRRGCVATSPTGFEVRGPHQRGNRFRQPVYAMRTRAASTPLRAQPSSWMTERFRRNRNCARNTMPAPPSRVTLPRGGGLHARRCRANYRCLSNALAVLGAHGAAGAERESGCG